MSAKLTIIYGLTINGGTYRMTNVVTTQQSIKQFLIDEFLAPEDAEDLDSQTELFSTGILDSLGTLKLISFIESEFGVAVEPRDATADRLQTIELIAAVVDAKR